MRHYRATGTASNTCIGGSAGRFIVGGGNNTSHNNITCIGTDSRTSASDQCQLGGWNGSTYQGIYAQAALNVRSDRRDKMDIRKNRLGLDFIMKLKPVQYRMNYRQSYSVLDPKTNLIVHHENDGSKASKRYHCGFIAQEVKADADELGEDFAGHQHHSYNGEGEDVHTLKYEEFISCMTLAMQEQQKMINDLKDQNKFLYNKVKSISEDLVKLKHSDPFDSASFNGLSGDRKQLI